MFRSYPGSIQRLGKRPYPQIRPMLPEQMPPVPFEPTSFVCDFQYEHEISPVSKP